MYTLGHRLAGNVDRLYRILTPSFSAQGGLLSSRTVC
jgi:hypothetical protein